MWGLRGLQRFTDWFNDRFLCEHSCVSQFHLSAASYHLGDFNETAVNYRNFSTNQRLWELTECVDEVIVLMLIVLTATIALTSGRPVDNTSDVIIISQPAIGWRMCDTCWHLTVALFNQVLYFQQIINIDTIAIRATNLLLLLGVAFKNVF